MSAFNHLAVYQLPKEQQLLILSYLLDYLAVRNATIDLRKFVEVVLPVIESLNVSPKIVDDLKSFFEKSQVDECWQDCLKLVSCRLRLVTEIHRFSDVFVESVKKSMDEIDDWFDMKVDEKPVVETEVQA